MAVKEPVQVFPRADGNDALPLVSVLIVTMNRRQELARCLEQVARQDYRPLEVVVVDNGSVDGTGEMVKARFPAVRYHRADGNLGAAGGRNLAFRLARGSLFVLLDDDAELMEEDALRRVVGRFREEPELGAVAFCIRRGTDGEVDPRAIPRRDKRLLPGWTPCTYFCGAGVALRRQAVECAGGFWESLFIYAEELDLSYRILECGYRMLHAADIGVLHHETPRARPSDRYIRFATRNRIWIAWRNLPWPQALTMSVAWSLKLGWQAARSGRFGAYLSGLGAAVRGLGAVRALRRPVGGSTRRLLRRHSGRWWY